MKYRVLKGVGIGQGRTVVPGEIIDGALLDAALLQNLIARQCVVPAGGGPAPPPMPGDEGTPPGGDVVRTREPEPEHREPRTRRKE